MRRTELEAHNGEIPLAGSLWTPEVDPIALVVMHPGSGPSDRDNDVFFPPIRHALGAAGIAVASFDKRGVGGSGGSWVEAGIEEQAEDLLAGLAAAGAHVPDVPAGVFGHSQGGWVALEAARRGRPMFVVTSSGPAVTVGDQERHSAKSSPSADLDVTDAFLTLAEAGASYADMLAWLAEADHAAGIAHLAGTEPPSEMLWGLLVRLTGYDPSTALQAIDVPLLAVFGADDDVIPVDDSVAILRSTVAPVLLQVAVLPGGGHRLCPRETDGYVPGYPDVVVEFVAAQRSTR